MPPDRQDGKPRQVALQSLIIRMASQGRLPCSPWHACWQSCGPQGSYTHSPALNNALGVVDGHVDTCRLVIPNVLPNQDTAAASVQVKQVWRLVFFSRLEERKGIKLFVEAVSRLGAGPLDKR